MIYGCFDTETTQLINNSLIPLKDQPRVVEFCMIAINDEGQIVRELEFLCYPECKISEEASKITGLTDEILKQHPPFSARIDDVIDIIGSIDKVVAHNLPFDMQMLNFEGQRCKKEIKWPKRRVCTVEATEHYKGYRLGLNALHEHLFGAGFDSAHRARVDVEALVRCSVELIKRGDI
jgi:DNA polymerase-3 subunit epsilon